MFRRRDEQLESRLQNALDSGCSVWVVGDVHGHLAAFENLIEHLELAPGDHVVCLGDLIDRGEDSAGVVRRVRQSHNIHSIMGNHEWFALQAMQEDGALYADKMWGFNGGLQTWQSYGLDDEDAVSAIITEEKVCLSGMASDVDWFRTLPIEVVLEKWRMVHAGYDPELSEEEQLVEDAITGMLWIRDPYHRHAEPWDAQRCVLFGHTPTCTIEGCGYGEVALSEVRLEDGRPAWLGLDTCMFNDHLNRLAAIDLNTSRIVLADEQKVWRTSLDVITPGAEVD